jgi:hypothetical protein
MKSWDQIIKEVTRSLDNERINYELTGDIIHTDLCTIEFSGSPLKPEYWVNETRIIRIENIPDAIHRCLTA